MARKEVPLVTERPAPTAASIAIFALVVALLFGGMYFFLPDSYQSTAPSPAVAERPAPQPAPPVTTGQGGNTK